MSEGRPTAFVCEDFVCQRPVTDAGDLREVLAVGLSQGRSGE
jgi:hypothetical protein